MELYSQILDHGGRAFGAILRHVRDKPNEGCLFHCTAGKDRTGVMAAIILKVRIRFVSRICDPTLILECVVSLLESLMKI